MARAADSSTEDEQTKHGLQIAGRTLRGIPLRYARSSAMVSEIGEVLVVQDPFIRDNVRVLFDGTVARHGWFTLKREQLEKLIDEAEHPHRPGHLR